MAVTETFANEPSTTVTAGGQDAPVSGTTQTWTVASSATFPGASTGATQFHVADPVLPTELIAVTNVSGTTWAVTRGAESTTPVAHAANFTVRQVISAGFLTSPVFTGAVSTGGITGATAASRYAGATASGAPASGTFATGDYVVDQTGRFWVCTAGGSPGTWQQTDTGSTSWLIASVPALAYTAVTYNISQAPTSAAVTWPDGTTGTWTADVLSTQFPGAVDAYHVTYGSKTVTQPQVTRNASGAVTAQPALTVA